MHCCSNRIIFAAAIMTLGAPTQETPGEQAFYRPCWAEVDLDALRANFRKLQSHVNKSVGILAVVKANAYGHGIIPAARVAISEGAVYLGVSSLEEGVQLRNAGISTAVLILGSLYPFDNFSVLFEKKLTPTVASVETAAALDRLAIDRNEKIPVHLKIDSGFGRIGVSLANALSFISEVSAMRGLVLEGIYTHFASSDVDSEYTETQTRAFMSVIDRAAHNGVKPRYVHLANSSAVLRIPLTHGSLVRPGLAFYGIPPYPGAEKEVALKPALTWKCRVIFLKSIAKGSSVSYARTWIAKRPSRIATLAMGYADGYPRLLSNKGMVLIKGHRAPVLGRVTMDMTMVDVTDIPDCHVGDEVVIIGEQGNERIRAEDIALSAQTNPYEIVCGISDRVQRIYSHG